MLYMYACTQYSMYACSIYSTPGAEKIHRNEATTVFMGYPLVSRYHMRIHTYITSVHTLHLYTPIIHERYISRVGYRYNFEQLVCSHSHRLAFHLAYITWDTYIRSVYTDHETYISRVGYKCKFEQLVCSHGLAFDLVVSNENTYITSVYTDHETYISRVGYRCKFEKLICYHGLAFHFFVYHHIRIHTQISIH